MSSSWLNCTLNLTVTGHWKCVNNCKSGDEVNEEVMEEEQEPAGRSIELGQFA